ncbi:hypothetical protein [Synechococcus sp. PCC 7336]|uniref:hypothetical protein n=1 Tax=Synechococcus sp. PCC 7336 TaxID=195250 RepID=UPI00187DCC74|nr:hypothetical protein [Synechococcus sp. PCC 7336]
MSNELQNTGLIGRVHGAAAPSQLYVMSVQEPENFFNRREFSLLARNGEIQTKLSQISRHDRVCVQGSFIPNPSPQKHILVNAIQVLESWSGLDGFPAYERGANIPAELVDRTNFVGKVHAIGEGGRILVVEYKDGVLPIFVESPEYTEGLYRGDIIRLSYRIQAFPSRPTHLKLDLETAQPIEVLDAIADWHGREQTLAGPLVKFPQSPQIQFDVYAIEVHTRGVKRYFTLVNFEDLDEFQAIRDRLAEIWDDRADKAISGRNWLIEPETIVEVRGRSNILSPEQANPQILLDSANKIHLKITKSAQSQGLKFNPPDSLTDRVAP